MTDPAADRSFSSRSTPPGVAPREKKRGDRVLVAALLSLALVACGSSAPTRAAAPTAATAAADGTTTTTATTVADVEATTTSVAATTTTPPTTAAPATMLPAEEPATTLPTPVAPPPEDRVEPENQVGRITIPRLGLDLSMFEGITLPTLDMGPGHWPGTAMPGQPGNVVVAGHRVSHTRPFRYIDRLVEGDEVTFTVGGASYRYVVTGHEIVTPDAVHIVDQTPTPTATLFACHPPGSTEFRWVVHLKLAP